MIFVLCALVLSTLGLGIWVFVLLMNAFRDHEIIMAKDKIIGNLRIQLDNAEKQLYD